MGLLEFLRQWPSRHRAAGVLASALLHGLLALAVLQWRPAPELHTQKRGDALIVELRDVGEPAEAGSPGAPARPPVPRPAPPAVARPEASPPPAARREAKVAPVPPQPAPQRAPEPLPPPRPAEAPAPAPTSQTVPLPAPVTPPLATPPAPVPPAPGPMLAAPAPPAAPQVGPPASQGGPPTSQGGPPAGEAVRPDARPPGADPGGPRVAALPPAPAVPDTRSALRRGAGGSGQGRGGVEGEPIPLDSADPKYTDYLEQVRRKIKEHWGFPCIPDMSRGRCEYKTTQLIVEFGIAKDGRVPFVEVRRSSGYPIYDDYAVNAIKFASPFPPVPDSISRTGFPVNATFRYVVESSLTNLLR